MKYDRQVALSAIFTRFGRGTFRHAEVSDIVPDWRALRYLYREGALERVEWDQKNGNVWQISPDGASRCASRPPIAPGTIPNYADAAILTIWRDRGREPFRTSEFRGVFGHARITSLVDRGHVEREPGTHGQQRATWRLTRQGERYAQALARQIEAHRTEGASA